MLAELTVLLHEMSDSLRSRVEPPNQPALNDTAMSDAEAVVLVTGLPSPGKARLVEALVLRLAPAHILVRTDRGHRATSELIVHAETDLEAMVEGALPPSQRAPADAAFIVPVDWEPVEQSVLRVVEALIARGHVPASLGAR